MAWIESHQSLSRHRKTLRASALLRINKYQLIGHLHELWWWALDNVPSDGALGDLMDEEIAMAAGWDGPATDFVDVLIVVGFIDRRDDERFLHDWYDYAGKLLEERERDRTRKRQERENKRRPSDRPEDVQRMSGGRHGDVQRMSGCTQPNPTQPTEPEKIVPPDTVPEARKDNPDPPGDKPPSVYSSEFETFWQNYPRKTEKKAAWKTWRTRLREGIAARDLILAATHYAAYHQQRGTELEYIKHPKTFLGPSRAFEEWVTASAASTGPPRLDAPYRSFSEAMEVN